LDVEAKKQNAKPVRGVLIKIDEVVARTGMKRTWIYSRIRTGRLPFAYFQLGPSTLRFDTADIDDWLHSVRVNVGE
jgi:prophage regulatory protein